MHQVVISLPVRRCTNVVKVLKELLVEAERGEMPALAYIRPYGRGEHRVGLVGEYRKSPEAALAALNTMERRIQWENSFRETM